MVAGMYFRTRPCFPFHCKAWTGTGSEFLDTNRFSVVGKSSTRVGFRDEMLTMIHEVEIHERIHKIVAHKEVAAQASALSAI